MKVDVWSLGMILVRQVFNISEFWPHARVGQILRKIISLGDCKDGAAVLEKLAREHNCLPRLNEMEPRLLELIQTCLTPHSADRPTPHQLLASSIFDNVAERDKLLMKYAPPAFPVMHLRCRNLSLKGK